MYATSVQHRILWTCDANKAGGMSEGRVVVPSLYDQLLQRVSEDFGWELINRVLESRRAQNILERHRRGTITKAGAESGLVQVMDSKKSMMLGVRRVPTIESAKLYYRYEEKVIKKLPKYSKVWLNVG